MRKIVIKIFALFLVSLLLTGIVPVIPIAAHHTYPFPDVSVSHPNYTAIEYLRVRKLISGYKDGKFKPSRNVNRAELVVMVTKARGLDPSIKTYNRCYNDVKKQWFADEVCYAESTGWLRNYGIRFRPSQNATASEAQNIIWRAFGLSLTSTSDNGGGIDRAEVAQLVYNAISQTGRLTPLPAPSYTLPPSYTTPPSSYNVPPGYSSPYVAPSTTVPPSYSVPPSFYSPQPPPSSYSSTYTCQLAGITTTPTRSAANYSISYCPLDNTGAPSTQILLGQSNLYPVWGENFNFTITEKLRAMSVAYASEMFNVNPNYLNALAIKESRMDCTYWGGCFQITGGFPEVRNRYPLYFDSNDSETALTNAFETAAVVASLYIRFGEALWDSLYQYRSFYQASSDSEVRMKIASRGYNRGLWDTTIRDITLTNRASCQAKTDVFQCFPTGPLTSPNGIALDHAQAIANYCKTLMQATSNFYDVRLTKQDMTDFIDRVLKPTFSQTAPVNWTVVTDRVNNAFDCLKSSDSTISFRYDFKTVLLRVKDVLPLVPAPVL